MHDLNFYTKKFDLYLYPKTEPLYYYLCKDMAIIQTSYKKTIFKPGRKLIYRHDIKTIWGFYSPNPIDDKRAKHDKGNKRAFTCEKYDVATSIFQGKEKIKMVKKHEGSNKFALEFVELIK